MKAHLIRSLSLAVCVACAGAGVHAAGNAASPGAATSGAGGSSSGTGASIRASDRTFMTKAAGGGLYEVEVSRLAEQKATDPSVKELAAMLVKDHTAANEELKQLASNKGVSLPTKPPRDKQTALDSLSRMSGASFDREYMRKVGIADHQADIKLFENGSRTARDPELKAWIDKTLPTLRQHLAHAQKTPLPGTGTAGKTGSATGTTGTGSANSTGAATGAGGAGGSRAMNPDANPGASTGTSTTGGAGGGTSGGAAGSVR